MRRKLPVFLLAIAVGWPAPARAQVPQWVGELLQAAQLPVVTLQARRDGVTNTEIRGLLDALRNANVPAPEAVIIVDSARVVRRDYGPVNNFGAFVQSQLASGKRGPALAAAIRAEHARMGKGRGNGMQGPPGLQGRDDGDRGRGQSVNPPGNRGRGDDGEADDDHGRGRGREDVAPGRPASPGKSEGKPAGKPENRGKGRPPVR